MDRLLRSDGELIERVCHYGHEERCFGCADKTKCNADIFERLAHYEDTGLEPEEIGEMKTAYDENQIPYMIEDTGSEAVHIYNLLLAKAQGRLVELPVGVGQTVWFSMIEDGPTEMTVYSVSFWIQSDCIHVLYETEDSSGITSHFHGEAIGKTVFLTRAEAEAAIAASRKEAY